MHDGEIADLAAADPARRAHRRHRAHPLHDLAPAGVQRRLIEAYAQRAAARDHLHLPVQSGSDRDLALMKRGYTALEYKDKMRRLREVRPDISLSTDFIVGFPGETERDFEATHGPDRRDRLRPVLSASSTARVPARRPPRCRARCRSRSSSAGCMRCRIASMRRRRHISRAWSARCSACWWRAVAQGCARARRAHREQPRGQFRRAGAGSSGVRRRAGSPRRCRNSLRGGCIESPVRRSAPQPNARAAANTVAKTVERS